MTGYQSKKAAAQAIDEVNWADHEPDGKKAAAQDKLAQQEPVAWMVYTQEGQSAFVTDNPAHIHPSQRALPLYTTPPRRTWVYLTDEHIKEIVGPYGDMPIKGYTRELFDQIEAKSKELNT